MYKAILFDLDNTLLNYDASELEAMQRTVHLHGLPDRDGFHWETFRAVYGPINWTYWIERTERKLQINQVLDYSFRDALQEMGQDSRLSTALAATYWELFCSSCHFMNGAEDLLASLNGSYQLGIVSNGVGAAQRKRLETGGILHYFPHLFISDEIGVGKPNKLIFDRAIEALGATHAEVLFVGDSLTDDYEGARAAGLDFCFYNPKRKPIGEEVAPTHAIHELSELLGILSREEGQR